MTRWPLLTLCGFLLTVGYVFTHPQLIGDILFGKDDLGLAPREFTVFDEYDAR